MFCARKKGIEGPKDKTRGRLDILVGGESTEAEADGGIALCRGEAQGAKYVGRLGNAGDACGPNTRHQRRVHGGRMGGRQTLSQSSVQENPGAQDE